MAWKLGAYESVLYSTADGDLLRDDPRQKKLDLREVPKPQPSGAPIQVAAAPAQAPIVPQSA